MGFGGVLWGGHPGWATLLLVVGGVAAALGVVFFTLACLDRSELFTVDAWHEPQRSGSPAVSYGTFSDIEADGGELASANAIVSGRIVANQRIVLDDVYVLFCRRRKWRFWMKQELCRADCGNYNRTLAALRSGHGLTMEAGQVLEIGERTLFSALNIVPRSALKPGGKWWAFLVVELLYPRALRRFDLPVRDTAAPQPPMRLRRRPR